MSSVEYIESCKSVCCSTTTTTGAINITTAVPITTSTLTAYTSTPAASTAVSTSVNAGSSIEFDSIRICRINFPLCRIYSTLCRICVARKKGGCSSTTTTIAVINRSTAVGIATSTPTAYASTPPASTAVYTSVNAVSSIKFDIIRIVLNITKVVVLLALLPLPLIELLP